MSANTNSSEPKRSVMTVDTEDFISKLSDQLKVEYEKMTKKTIEKLDMAMNAVTKADETVAEVKEMVGEAVGGALENMVGEAIGGALEKKVEEAVGDALEKLGESFQSALSEMVDEAVQSALPKMVDEAVLRALAEMPHRPAE